MLDLLLALALIALVAALVNAVLPGRDEEPDDEGGRAPQELGVAIEIPWAAIASGAITAMALLVVDLPLSIVLAVAFLAGMVCHVALRALAALLTHESKQCQLNSCATLYAISCAGRDVCKQLAAFKPLDRLRGTPPPPPLSSHQAA